MHGLGTIVNCLAIVAGGVIGLLGGKLIRERFRDTLMKAMGICVLFIGASGALAKILTVSGSSLQTGGTMMMIGCFAIGSIIGEAIDLDRRMESFGEWLKKKTGNAGDAGFIDGFVTASLTVSIGAMAVVGSIQDGIYGDHATLFAKSVLDFIIVLVMAASLGKGCIFSAITVGVFQGSITLLARAVEPLLTDQAMTNLSLTGSMLIFCVGVNLVFGKKLKVANMLPAIVIAVIWALF